MKVKLLGVPLAKQSFKITRKGFKYTDKKVVDWKSQARAQIVNQLPSRWVPIVDEIKVSNLTFVFPLLKSFPKYKVKEIKEGVIHYRASKPDLDNLQKSLWDACEGLLFLNDSQIVRYDGTTCKIYGEVPRIEFEIEKI